MAKRKQGAQVDDALLLQIDGYADEVLLNEAMSVLYATALTNEQWMIACIEQNYVAYDAAKAARDTAEAEWQAYYEELLDRGLSDRFSEEFEPGMTVREARQAAWQRCGRGEGEE